MADKIFQTDVLVIGAGGAGLRSALELHHRKVPVLVVGKSKRRDAHTVLAEGGINAALGTMDPKDNWLIHAADTLKEGMYLANSHLVQLLCREAPHALYELVSWGVHFHHEKDGRLTQRFFGAHTYRRTCFVGDKTGRAIIDVLTRQVEKAKIPVLNDVYVISLLQVKDVVVGAWGIHIPTGKIIAVHAKAVILATGGHSRCYSRSTSRFWENTGDGISLAYNVGASLMDMEMIQFHPTGMIHPKEMEGVLVTEAVRGEGGILTNKEGEHFMKRYDPQRMELSARDIVARANYQEIIAGRGTKHGGVWLDISMRPKKYIQTRLPGMYNQFKKIGIDISRQRMEVAPTAHYAMGGIHVDSKTFSAGVPGLYAVGEVTGGLHGANRLGGNSLAEILVFGRFVGRAVAHAIHGKHHIPFPEDMLRAEEKKLFLLFGRQGKGDPRALKQALQEGMWVNAGIIRTGKQLLRGIKLVEDIKKRLGHVTLSGKVKNNDMLQAYLDTGAMLIASEAILRSAMMRKESRGAHYRSDFPNLDKKRRMNIICTKGKKGMQIKMNKVPGISGQLRHMLREKWKAEHHLLE